MKVWWLLFKKEFRLMQKFWFIAGLLVILLGLIGAYIASQFNSGIPSLVLFMLLFFHSFYLFLYLISSLQAEKNNTPIWMQSPQSGVFLLSVKFAAGFILMLTMVVLNFILWSWTVDLDFQSGLYQGGAYFQSLLVIKDLIKQHLLLTLLVFTQRALFLASFGSLIYFFIDLLKYAIKAWRWVVGLVLFFIGIILVIWLNNTAFFDLFFHWGKLDLTGFSALSYQWTVQGPPVTIIFQSFFPVYVGSIVFNYLISAACFLMSSWLLDRKVEV